MTAPSDPSVSATTPPTPAPRRYGKLIALVVTLVVIGWSARHFGLLEFASPERVRALVTTARETAWAIPAFILLYAVVASLGLPGTPLTLAGGALFGAVGGTFANWTGATLGATGAFLLARALGADAVRGLLGKHASALNALGGDQAFGALVRLRLIPVVPFNALNFGAGLAGVRLGPYVASTALGIIPGTAIYTYFADALLAGVDGARGAAFTQLAIASALLLALSFVPTVIKRLSARRVASAAAVLVLSSASALDAQTAPRASVDHSSWTALLTAHVTDGMVDYDAFAKDARFPAYLALLDRTDPRTLGRDERLAYWINVYNAYTIALINQRNERKSIRNINRVFGIPTKSPWAEPVVRAGGRVLSLDDVEHKIIRVEFGEPRIHVALVCAAMGCPPLRSEAYVAERLDAQLGEQVRRFLAQREKNRVDVATKTVYGSPIFTWYREDFGGTLKGVGSFLAPYASDPATAALLRSGDFSWFDTDYDWSLNIRHRSTRR
ncbi:MAG: DUF547 domain-containing protein [Gemmatimonadaceae bacterium]|nr:DUF547 domain-containing protein [Gemmatimonadaceae bacterium]